MQAFFKIMFGDTGVDVSYPGDKVIKPSDSTWSKQPVLRVQAWDEIISNVNSRYTTPNKLIGAEICLKSLNDTEEVVYGKTVVDYVSTYYYEGKVQYEVTLNEDKRSGTFTPNPSTFLTRDLLASGNNNDNKDVTTVTVNSTLEFPESGIIVVGNEGIRYTSKTYNQFLGCTRGVIGVELDRPRGTEVFGPYYLEGSVNIDGEERISTSWPLGLVTGVDILDGGILNEELDPIGINGPGDSDPEEVILQTIRENYDDDLISQANTMPNMADCQNFTWGPNSVYFNDNFVFVSASGFPEQQIGPFSTDDTVGPSMVGRRIVHTIPRRSSAVLKEPTVRGGHGTGPIGVAIDGVSFWSNRSDQVLLLVRSSKER